MKFILWVCDGCGKQDKQDVSGPGNRVQKMPDGWMGANVHLFAEGMKSRIKAHHFCKKCGVERGLRVEYPKQLKAKT